MPAGAFDDLVPQLRRGARRLRRVWSRPAPAANGGQRGSVVNLARNPSFRRTEGTREVDVDGVRRTVEVFDQPVGAGGVFVHPCCVAFSDDVPFRPGLRGVRVVATGEDNDSHIAPGGRNGTNALRMGMRPGQTYTVSVGVALEAPLTGELRGTALRISFGAVAGGSVLWTLAQSAPARNEPGDHRISLTFTVPDDATAAWVRLTAGMSAGHGSVVWHSFALTRTDHPVPFFDGETRDLFHDYRWLTTPDASSSVRVPRTLDQVAAAAGLAGEGLRRLVADEVARAAAARDLAAAGHFAAALAGAERDALAFVAASRVARAGGDDAAADAALEEALGLGDPGGDAALELGRLARADRRWTDAAEHVRTAVDRRPDDVDRSYRLADVLARLRRRPEAVAALEHAVGLDRDPPFDVAAAVSRSIDAVGARREVAAFVTDELATIRAMARARLGTLRSSTLDQPVFVYWGQGFATAPPIVRTCVERLREVVPAADLHELDDASLPFYVSLPADLLAAVGDDRTHRSDLLRLALLEQYGGVWVDATCLVTQPLRPHVDAVLADSDFFAFTYSESRLSSWFLAARPGSHVVRTWRAAMWRWWEVRGELNDYFLLHHVFEVLHELDEEFRAEARRMPGLSSHPPHDLQRAMLTAYDPQAFTDVVGRSFVHKLNYKVRPEQVTPGMTAAHLLRGEHPAF